MKGAKTRVIDAGGRAVSPACTTRMATSPASDRPCSRSICAARRPTRPSSTRSASARADGAAGRMDSRAELGSERLADKEWPTHEALDKAAPDNPVYLTRVDGHAALANKAALDAAGITAKHGRSGGRAPHSRCQRQCRPASSSTRAMGLVRRKMSAPSAAQLDEQVTARRRRMPPARTDHGPRRRRRRRHGRSPTSA